MRNLNYIRTFKPLYWPITSPLGENPESKQERSSQNGPFEHYHTFPTNRVLKNVKMSAYGVFVGQLQRDPPSDVVLELRLEQVLHFLRVGQVDQHSIGVLL